MTLISLTSELFVFSEPRFRIMIKGNARPLNAKSSAASTDPRDAFVRRYTRDLRTCVRIIRRTFTTRNSDEDLTEISVCEAARWASTSTSIFMQNVAGGGYANNNIGWNARVYVRGMMSMCECGRLPEYKRVRDRVRWRDFSKCEN